MHTDAPPVLCDALVTQRQCADQSITNRLALTIVAERTSRACVEWCNAIEGTECCQFDKVAGYCYAYSGAELQSLVTFFTLKSMRAGICVPNPHYSPRQEVRETRASTSTSAPTQSTIGSTSTVGGETTTDGGPPPEFRLPGPSLATTAITIDVPAEIAYCAEAKSVVDPSRHSARDN